MKYLLFLSYDTCKIGLANWTWPKVKRKLSGGTRTNRRPPECWAHFIWAKYSAVPGSWLLVYLSPLIRVLVADLGNQHFPVFLARGIQWVQPNKGDQKGEQRNVNDKSCLSYQQTKPAGRSSHQPLLTLISALRRDLSVVGVGNGNPWQYSCLKNPMKRGAWWATVHGVPQSWIWLSVHDWTETVGP